MSAGTQISNHKIVPLYKNEIDEYIYQSGWADTIPLKGAIDSNLKWVNNTGFLHGYSNSMGNVPVNWGLFSNTKEKFIGVKVYVKDKILYGWIRVEISDWQIILTDYACTVGYN